MEDAADIHMSSLSESAHDPLGIEKKWSPPTSDHIEGSFCHPAALILSCLFPCVLLGSCSVLSEREENVILVCGQYNRTYRVPGCYFFNCCCASTYTVRTSLEAVDLPNIKVVDKSGCPLIVSAVLTYRVVDSRKAVLDVGELGVGSTRRFLMTKASAVLKAVVSQFSYEGEEGESSLRTEAHEIAQRMVEELQNEANQCGVMVVSMRINEMSYAPEIAASMLRRQQAGALVKAREIVVDGAVSITSNAVEELEKQGIVLGPQEKARLIGNLLTVICSDSSVTPTLPVQ